MGYWLGMFNEFATTCVRSELEPAHSVHTLRVHKVRSYNKTTTWNIEYRDKKTDKLKWFTVEGDRFPVDDAVTRLRLLLM